MAKTNSDIGSMVSWGYSGKRKLQDMIWHTSLTVELMKLQRIMWQKKNT